MKIGMFTNTYRPVISGVVISIDTFKKGLEDLGQEVHIFAPHYYNARKEKNIHRYKSIDIDLSSEFNPLKTLIFHSLSQRIPKQVEKIGLDIIHSHHPWILGNAAEHFASEQDIPLVFTYHTQYDKYAHYIPFNKEIISNLAKKLSLDYCSKCDCVIAPTESIKKMLLKNKVRTRIEVIPTGIDISSYEDTDSKRIRKKYGLKERPVLLFVGRIGMEKNIAFVLRSMKEVLNHVPDAMLLLVGTGPAEEELKQTASDLEIKDNIVFTGNVSHKDIPDYYAAADLFVFASTTETQGLVFLEAKAAGLPVVAVKSYGSQDIIRDKKDGILSKHSVKDFSKSIIYLLDDDEMRKKMSLAAKKDVQRYSTEETSKKLLSVYESLTKTEK